MGGKCRYRFFVRDGKVGHDAHNGLIFSEVIFDEGDAFSGNRRDNDFPFSREGLQLLQNFGQVLGFDGEKDNVGKSRQFFQLEKGKFNVFSNLIKIGKTKVVFVFEALVDGRRQITKADKSVVHFIF